MSAVAFQNMEVSPCELVESAQADFEGPLTGYAAQLLGGDWERARDVVQDTFIKLHRQDPEAIRGKLKSWLYTVCRNRSIDILRKEKPMTTTDATELAAVREEIKLLQNRADELRDSILLMSDKVLH